MHKSGSKLHYSATDLSNFLSCPHVAALDLQAVAGTLKKPHFDDPAVEVLKKRGLEHEAVVRDGFRERGLAVQEVPDPPWTDGVTNWQAGLDATLAAMRAGVDVVYQGTFYDGTWVGRPDFLLKVDTPSDLGDWSYEVVDAKLSKEAKAGAVLQISLYSDLLGAMLGRAPEYMHLALRSGEEGFETFGVADYAAYYRFVKRSFGAWTSETSSRHESYPEPVSHCDICDWQPVCRSQWRGDDHLSLVAGITRRHRQELTARDIETVEALATLALPPQPQFQTVSEVSLTRIREQARIQVEGREAERVLYELLTPMEAGAGLAALPAPSEGDVFFDIEGDRYAFDDGIEYLFGYVDRGAEFIGLWALNRSEERAQFEAFIDMVMDRLEQYPDLHIYHYAPYEPSAMKRLMGRYGTREEEVDRLLRGRVFVDLYRVVRQALRASVESYSIKRLEPLYGYERYVGLRAASGALANFEAWLELGGGGQSDRSLLEQIEGYNKDDCVSTLWLANWLEGLRPELAELVDEEIPRPLPSDAEPVESVREEIAEVQELYDGLTEGVPADPADRSEEQHARWILANLLSWHRREGKSVWWEYYRCLELDEEELIEDRATLGGLEYVGVVEELPRSFVHRYHFPHQEHKMDRGDTPQDPETRKTIVAVDDVQGTIDLKRSRTSEAPHPAALVSLDAVGDDEQRGSLLRLAQDVIANGLEECQNRAAADLLLRRPPRVGQAEAEALAHYEERKLDAARRLVHKLDATVLPIQGPPGAGKTYTGARMIVQLLSAGKRVGIVATSHKVIGHLLKEVCEAGEEKGVVIHGIQKADKGQWCGREEIVRAGSNAKVLGALTEGEIRLAAGTAWLWSRPEMARAVDVLFADEAGQMSLANVLAIVQAGSSLVLLGDPQQLEQPQKGVHPPGADVSALDHLVGGMATLMDDRGLFLDQTWRLSPEICAFTSELYYGGRLVSRDGLEAQVVRGPTALAGSGLRFVPVEHFGNTNESTEEVEAVAGLVSELLSGNWSWVDEQAEESVVTLSDLLIVAPYNAQVALLREALPEGSRIGTVDKFQGQEAAIVIFSPASSSAEEAPRGMEFLYSPNRLNVATSRARCLAVIVGSPKLFGPHCKSVRQMKLANGFCRFAEMAGGAGRVSR